MKKFTLLFTIIIISSFVLFTGCSSDDDSSNDNGNGDGLFTPGDFENGEYDIVLQVFDLNLKNEKFIYIYPASFFVDGYAENFDCTLKINDEEVELISETFTGLKYCNYELTEGETYNFSITTAKSTYSSDLKIAYDPSYPFPQTYDPNQETEFTWTLEGDNNYQLFEGWSEYYDWENDEDKSDYKYIELNPSDRTCTIPANWLDDFNEDPQELLYDFDLVEYNYILENNSVFISVEAETVTYSDFERKERNKTRIEILNRVLDNLD